MRSLCPNLQSRPSPQLWASVDPDVAAWRAAILANGGTVSPDAVRAVNTFTRGLKADGVWPLIIDMGILCGVGNLNAALVKLKTAPGVSRLLVNTNFVGADYTPTGAGAGLKGNGTSKYLDTGFVPSAHLTTSSGGLSRYVTASGSTGIRIDGCRSVDDAFTSDAPNSLTQITGHLGGTSSSRTVYTGWTGAGFITASRTSLTSNSLYVNGASVATNSTNQSGGLPTITFLISAYNNNGGAQFFGTETKSFHSIHLGLTPAQVAALAARVNTLMTAFGANVY